MARQVERTSETFDNELQRQIDGTLPTGHIYQLGRPGSIMRSTGIPDLPIQLSASRLAQKSSDKGHPFDIADAKGLVKALQSPIAIFAYGNKEKAQNLIVEISSNGKNLLVGLSLNPIVGRRVLNINSIRNVFPKDTAEWLHWIEQGKLLYADKEKIQAPIDQQRINLADVEYLDLEKVGAVLDAFENPQVASEQTLGGTGGIIPNSDGNVNLSTSVSAIPAAAADGKGAGAVGGGEDGSGLSFSGVRTASVVEADGLDKPGRYRRT